MTKFLEFLVEILGAEMYFKFSLFMAGILNRTEVRYLGGDKFSVNGAVVERLGYTTFIAPGVEPASREEKTIGTVMAFYP